MNCNEILYVYERSTLKLIQILMNFPSRERTVSIEKSSSLNIYFLSKNGTVLYLAEIMIVPDELLYLQNMKYQIEQIYINENLTLNYREILTAKTPITFQRMLDSNLVFREKAPKASTLGFRFFVHRVCNIFEKTVSMLKTNS
jgi:hypothetical protein